MAKRKLSLVQKEYQKNRKRVQSYIREFRKIGYKVDESILPSIPKKITQASVRRLQKITKKVFREKLTEFIDYETGEVLEGKEARKKEKEIRKLQREAKRKPKQAVQRSKTIEQPISTYPTFNVYEEIRSRLLDFPSGKWVQGSNGRPMYYEFNTNTNILISILDDNISLDGYEKYLFSKEEQIVAEFDSIIYKESTQDQCDYSFVTLANELDYGRLYMDKTSTAEELSNMTDYYSLFGL